MDDFDGAPYTRHWGSIHTKFEAMMDAGNRKDVLVYAMDDEGSYITE